MPSMAVAETGAGTKDDDEEEEEEEDEDDEDDDELPAPTSRRAARDAAAGFIALLDAGARPLRAAETAAGAAPAALPTVLDAGATLLPLIPDFALAVAASASFSLPTRALL
jgi:hypothetical protein